MGCTPQRYLPCFCKDKDFLGRLLEENSKYAWQVKRKKIYEIIDEIHYTSVLDIGCANGEELRRYVKEGKVGCGLDIKKFNWENTHNLSFLVSDAQNLPFKASSFDLVVATEVIEHLPNHDLFLSEVYRVLKDKGYFILSTPNQLMITALLMRVIEFIGGKKFLDAPGHISKVTPLKLKRELKETGFKVEYIDYGAFNPYIFPPYFLIFHELKFINVIYKWLDKITNFRILKPITKWDMMINAKKMKDNERRWS